MEITSLFVDYSFVSTCIYVSYFILLLYIVTFDLYNQGSPFTEECCSVDNRHELDQFRRFVELQW